MAEACSAIIMAAGQGTRMKSSLPKVLHPLLGRTLLGHAMHAVMGLDPESVVVVVRHDRDRVAEEAVEVLPDAIIADQDEVPGTGRAVFCGLEGAAEAGEPIRGTVLVTSADVPLLKTETLRELVDQHEKSGAAVTLVSTISEDPTGYGRVVRQADGDDAGKDEDALRETAPVVAIVEHRDATDAQRAIREINAGIYAFDAEFLFDALSRVGQDNDQGEVYLTDTVALAVAEGRLVSAFVLDDPWQAEGCNDRWQLAALRAELNQRICKAHCVAGVSVEDPANTSIDVEVTIGKDAVIKPFTSLVGRTNVGPNATVGPNSTVIDASVGEGAYAPQSHLAGVSVEPGVRLAPFTAMNAIK